MVLHRRGAARLEWGIQDRRPCSDPWCPCRCRSARRSVDGSGVGGCRDHRRPDRDRLRGLGGRSAGLIYAGFGAFVIYALVRRLPIQSCGCFGKSDTPPTWTHVGFNLISAAGGIGIAFSGTAPISLLADQPAWGIPYLGFVAIGVVVVYLLLAELPQLRTSST
jgi:hypothetical protein